MSIQITEVPAADILYIPPHRRAQSQRSSGVHYSTPINDLYYRVMKGYKNDAEGMSGQAAVFEAGFSFEEMLEQAFAARQGERLRYLHGVERPGELRYEEFFMSPDGVEHDKRLVAVDHEYKLTTRSASNLLSFDKEFPQWVWQAAGYCLALNTIYTTWWVLCVGRAQLYKTDPFRAARLYRVDRQFQEGEREYHYGVVKNHLQVMRRNGMVVEEVHSVESVEPPVAVPKRKRGLLLPTRRTE